jgi:hypothetical protein
MGKILQPNTGKEKTMNFDDYSKEIERLRESEELAWGLIANAYGGDWDLASEASGWKAAAIRWRDDYQSTLSMAEVD